MAFFVHEMSQLESMTVFTRRAEGIYEENLAAYIKIVFRRPFGKIIVGGFAFVPGMLVLTNTFRISLRVSIALQKIQARLKRCPIAALTSRH